MAVTVQSISRESVTLAWEMHPDAYAYMVRRISRVSDDLREDILRAMVYEGQYCDPGLSAGTEYMYELSSVPHPDAEEPAEPVDRQRVRVRTPPELEYPTARAFFVDFVAPTFRRRLHQNAHRWCPEWTRHPEALYAVTELWNAYEAMRPPEPPQHPGKIRAEWLITMGWPVLDKLSAQEGPFRDCALNDDEGIGDRHMDLPVAAVQPLPCA